MVMRPINVSLDDVTYEIAKKKSNFSAWVRSKLREENLQREAFYNEMSIYQCSDCGTLSKWPKDEKYKFCRNSRGCSGQSELTEVTE